MGCGVRARMKPGETMNEGGGRPRGRVTAWLVAGTIVYFGVLVAALSLWGEYDEGRFRAIGANWFGAGAEAAWPDGTAGLARHFATWDAQHYLYLSQAGYGPGVKSNAFYPLWPLAIGWGTALTGWDGVVVGMVLANGCALGAWVLFHGIAARRFGREVGDLGLVLLLVFPGSLFQRFVYSEGLFLLLLMGLWNGLERRRYGWAGLAALLLPMTRGVGVFCVLPVLWHWGVRVREVGLRGLGWRSAATGLGLVLGPVAGWGVYLVLMGAWTGNPLAGMEAQRHWGAHAVGNLWDVVKFLEGFLSPTSWHDFRGSMLDRLMFLLVLVALPAIRRLGWDMVVWTYVLAVIPAMSGTFVSFTRFAGCAFPVFLGLAWLLSRIGSRDGRLRWGVVGVVGVVGVFATLHGVLVWRFVNFRWAG